MKFIKCIFLFSFFLSSCTSKKDMRDVKDPDQMKPPYKLINLFSRKIQPQTDLVLCGYGYNWCLPNDYEIKNGIGNFAAAYNLIKKKNDSFSLDYARNLIVFLAENLLNEINNNLEVRPDLDVYPFTSDFIDITIHFEDEKRIDLGQGVAIIYLAHGKIKYEGYEIYEYRDRFPAVGNHYLIHEESYAEALDIVKKQGTLTYLQEPCNKTDSSDLKKTDSL